MTDIVQRLREMQADMNDAIEKMDASAFDTGMMRQIRAEQHDFYKEAADEIERLRAEVEALRAEVEALRADAERFASFAFPPFCDEYAGVDLYEQASIYAYASGREEPDRDDYVAALRDAVDAALAQAKEGA